MRVRQAGQSFEKGVGRGFAALTLTHVPRNVTSVTRVCFDRAVQLTVLCKLLA
jgi:hypothetical protein